MQDIYHVIAEHLDWNTLQNFKLANKLFYYIFKKEKYKRSHSRSHSRYPLGEKDAKISLLVNDLYLEKVYCIIGDKEIEIPDNKMTLPYITNVLDTWFHYSFRLEKWILTGKIIKSVICLGNKTPDPEKIVNDIMKLTFSFSEGNSYLISFL